MGSGRIRSGAGRRKLELLIELNSLGNK